MGLGTRGMRAQLALNTKQTGNSRGWEDVSVKWQKSPNTSGKQRPAGFSPRCLISPDNTSIVIADYATVGTEPTCSLAGC